MFNQTICNQMVDFQKATLDNSFTTMAKLQEQGEAMLGVFLNQAPWMPEEGKKTIKEWTKGCRTTRDDFQKIVNENFKSIATYTQEFAAPAKKSSKAK